MQNLPTEFDFNPQHYSELYEAINFFEATMKIYQDSISAMGLVNQEDFLGYSDSSTAHLNVSAKCFFEANSQ